MTRTCTEVTVRAFPAQRVGLTDWAQCSQLVYLDSTSFHLIVHLNSQEGRCRNLVLGRRRSLPIEGIKTSKLEASFPALDGRHDRGSQHACSASPHVDDLTASVAALVAIQDDVTVSSIELTIGRQ